MTVARKTTGTPTSGLPAGDRLAMGEELDDMSERPYEQYSDAELEREEEGLLAVLNGTDAEKWEILKAYPSGGDDFLESEEWQAIKQRNSGIRAKLNLIMQEQGLRTDG